MNPLNSANSNTRPPPPLV